MGPSMSAKSLTIDKHARRELYVHDAKLVAKTDEGGKGSGFIEGYLAVWNNVDHQNEIIEPGTFARSIKTQIPARKVKLMTRHFAHGGDTLDCIGTVIEAKEDDHGLWIRGELSAIPRAQEVRTLVSEKHVQGLSVGFYPVTWKFQEQENNEPAIVRHTEAILAEGTVTVRPANELAEITAFKQHDSKPASQGTEKDAPGGTAKTTASTATDATALTRMKAEIAQERAQLLQLEIEVSLNGE